MWSKCVCKSNIGVFLFQRHMQAPAMTGTMSQAAYHQHCNLPGLQPYGPHPEKSRRTRLLWKQLNSCSLPFRASPCPDRREQGRTWVVWGSVCPLWVWAKDSCLVCPGKWGSTFQHVWKYFQLSQLGCRCYWHLVGWDQGCCQTSCKAQDGPHNKDGWKVHSAETDKPWSAQWGCPKNVRKCPFS